MSLLPYSPSRRYPLAAKSYGVYIEDEDGKVYLDASGGPAAISVGHTAPEVVAAMTEQINRLTYAHPSQFHTRAGLELAALLADRFPGARSGARVVFTAGGSEAAETALKIVRQYWLAKNRPEKTRIVSRWYSYHGATMGALGISGNLRRRVPYLPLLGPGTHASACYCYRCPFGKTHPSCSLECAQDLAEHLADGLAAAVFVEPIVGASSGAVPPDEYLPYIRSACDRHGALLVADEVMTGCGRTGEYLAIQHWGVQPDLILMGKGLSSGHAPLGAVLLSPEVADTLVRANAFLDHSFTYQCHPPSLAAGLAVQRILMRDNLVEAAAKMGTYLGRRLREIADLEPVGEIRGKGLMWTIEFVADKASRAPYPRHIRFSERVFEELRGRGVLVYPCGGTVGGEAGDHILITPPLTFQREHVDRLITGLSDAILATCANLGQECGAAIGR